MDSRSLCTRFGLGIGWLTGLSVSPIVSGVVTSLLGIAAGVVAGLQAIKGSKPEGSDRHETRIDACPAALLVIGIAIASTLGILARTYGAFEPDQIRQRVKRDDSKRGVLFTDYKDECEKLLDLAKIGNYEALVGELENSKLPGAVQLLSRFSHDPEALKFIVVEVLCKQHLDSGNRVQDP